MKQQAVVEIKSGPRATIATILCNEFDFHLTNQFKAELATATAGSESLPLILDLTNVGFMPSVTLGALVELRSRLARDQRQLRLAGVQPAIVKLLQTTGMLNIFDLHNNVDEAVNH